MRHRLNRRTRRSHDSVWRAFRRGWQLRFPPCCVGHFAWDVHCDASPGLARWRQIECCRDYSGRAVPCGIFHKGDSPFGLVRRIRSILRATRERLSRSPAARRRRELDPWHTRRPERVGMKAAAVDRELGYRGFDEAIEEFEPWLGKHVLVERLFINCARGAGEFTGQRGEGLLVPGLKDLRLERLPPPRDDDCWPYDRVIYFGSGDRPGWPAVWLDPKDLKWVRAEGDSLLVAHGPILTRISPFGRSWPWQHRKPMVVAEANCSGRAEGRGQRGALQRFVEFDK